MHRHFHDKYHSRRQVGRFIVSLLAFVLLFGCGGTSSVPAGTPTPRATLPPTPPAPGITASPGQSPTPSQVALVTPTPTLKPSPRPTPSLCDTPPGVQPVSPSEIDIGDTSRPRIALTFDAGGPSEPTARILDILATYHLHVTFFVTGEWANQNPDLVRRIHVDGHEIGNHTMHHLDLRTLTDSQVCSELTQANQVIANLTGVTARPYFRPPYGSRDDRVRRLAAQFGYRTVYWTVDTLDWQTSATSASITRIVMGRLGNGVIVLMHAGSQVESETLDGLIPKIEQAGYQIVAVTQVLQ